MKRLEYRRAVITYVDVLGFKELVEQREAADVGNVLAEFEGHAAPYFLAESKGLSYVAFSDLIVRLSPIADDGDLVEISDRLTTEMSDIAAAQTQLCQQGIVVRGAITVGAIVAEPGRIFGPGLIRAYMLESQLAKYPRVIIDSDVVELLGLAPWLDDPTADGEDFPAHVMEPCQYALRDDDGEVFIDYLGAICELGNDGTAEAFAEEHLLHEKHERTVRVGLSSQEARKRAKYVWLRDYHNRIVGSDSSTYIIADGASY